MCNFIKVPKYLIDGENNILNRGGRKCVETYLYMLTHKTRLGYTYFTLESIILESNYKLNRNKGKTNDNFKDSILWLQENNYIQKADFNNQSKVKDLCKCIINDVDEKYFKINIDEIHKLSLYDGKSYTQILLIFLYIKSKIYRRSKTECLEHGKFEICFPSYKAIENVLGIGQGHISEYLNELSNLNLIKYKKLPDMIGENGDITYGSNVYVDCIGDWESELEGGFKSFVKIRKRKGYKIVKPKDNRSLGGRKSILMKKIIDNTATDKDFEELKSINILLSKVKNDMKI